MSRNKIIQSATRLTQRGHLDRAITEYERLVAQDPADIRSRLKIGELQQRQGQNAQAAKTLAEAGELYANQGFFLKAVAVYKQVLKLTDDVQANERLADLYQQLGLLTEAMQQLQVVVGLHEQAGRVEMTVAVLRKMMDLGPDNVLGRIRLADLLGQLGRREEALDELRRAAAQLEKEGRTDDYLRVVDRILALEPENGLLARRAAEAYLAKGEPRKALGKLQFSFKADPSCVDTLRLLARSFGELGETEKQVAVLKELARGARAAGRHQEERELWAQVAKLAPQDPAVREAMGAQPQQAPPPERSLTPPPLPAGQRTGERAVAVPAPQGNAKGIGLPAPGGAPPAPAPSLGPVGSAGPAAGAGTGSPVAAASPADAARLLAETDVYLKYKLFPKADEHVRSLLALDPGALDVLERGVAVAEGLGDRESLRQRLISLAENAAAAGELQRGGKALQKLQAEFPDLPELAQLAARLREGSVSGLIVVEGDTEAGEVLLVVDPEDEPLSFGSIPVEEEPDDLALESAIEISVRGISDEQIVHEPLLEEQPAETAPAAVPVVPTVPVAAPVAVPAREAAPAPAPPAPAASAAPAAPVAPAAPPTQAAFAAPPVQATPPVAAPPVQASEPSPQALAAAAADLEEARFYLEQGMEEDAEELLRSILVRVPGHRDAKALLATVGGEAAQLAPPAPAVPTVPQPTPAVQAPAAAAPPTKPAAPFAAAAPAAKPAAPATPAAAAGRPAPPAFGGAVAPLDLPSEGTFDLAAALLGDLGDDDEEEAAPASADFQYSVEEVLAEFKKGVSQTVRPEDSETHYNLGIAYKEMGLLEDAISQFDQARAGSVGTQRELDCWITAGLCHAEMGSHEAAIDSFRSGLGAAAITAESALALHFEIGRSFEALGDATQALDHYGRVQRANSGYPGVAEALARLGQGAAELKTGKVGYV